MIDQFLRLEESLSAILLPSGRWKRPLICSAFMASIKVSFMANIKVSFMASIKVSFMASIKVS